MTKEQTFLLYLMKYAIQGKKLQEIPGEEPQNWESLNREAWDHSVPVLFFDVISLLEDRLPPEMYKKSFEIARRITAGNLRMEYAQHELVRVLEQERIPYVILKGEASSAYYPVPELRALGDVDFLVPVEQMEKVTERMTAMGYRHSWEPGEHHQIFGKGKTFLEMHMEIGGLPEGKHRTTVEAFLEGIYERSVLAPSGSFRMPCGAHQGMILVLHMQRHVVSKGMGLRHIMDWACFVDRTAGDPFWNEELLPVLKKIGMLRFAAAMTKTASVYLGTACPAWACDIPEELCRDLMEDVMSGGNFGCKDADRSRAINMMPDWEKQDKESNKLKLLYQTLRNSVHKQHPELENKPVATFCHMVGKTGRYMVLYCQGKRPNLFKAAAHADTRISVYEQLHMFESEN